MYYGFLRKKSPRKSRFLQVGLPKYALKNLQAKSHLPSSNRLLSERHLTFIGRVERQACTRYLEISAENFSLTEGKKEGEEGGEGRFDG